MTKFEFTKTVDVNRELIFQISTDYENFTKILPDYFKEIKIIERNGNATKIQERLEFLGRTINVMTEHVIEQPQRHIIKMLDGKASGTVFDEKYEKFGEKTKLTITVDLKLHGGLKFLAKFAKRKIEENMNMVMDEFVNYAKSKST